MIIRLIYKLLLKVLRKFVKVDGDFVSDLYISLIIASQIGCRAILLDGKYKVVDIEKWKEIIKLDTLNEVKKWKAEVFDCDNFALVFTAHISEMYEINSCGIALGTVYNASTGERIGYHAYNVIVAREGKDLVCYLYEPQTDGLAKASKKTKLGNWIYETEIVIIG